MNILDRKEKELKKLWKLSQTVNGDLKEEVLHRFWSEYRILRKTKKFVKKIKSSDSHKVHAEAA